MNLLRFLACLPLFFLVLPEASAQIADNFSDGDLTQNPAWAGNPDSFRINTAGELQLDAAVAGAVRLSVAGNIPDSAVWEFRFRLDFAPSNNNQLKIWLLADQADLDAASGYFFEIGETGSLDALRFYRQDAGVKTLIASGTPALVASNPDIRLRVRRTKAGVWEAEAAAGSGAFQAQFSVSDAAYTGGPNRHFGIQCIYTASNTTRFYFDDLSIVPNVPDTTPPTLSAVSASDAVTVVVQFDETLDSLGAIDPSRYSIDKGIGQPQTVALLANRQSVRLTLATPLATDTYILQANGIKDLAGNAGGVQNASFQFQKIEAAGEFDILINEIMADPAPGVGLPEVEWLELYNRSGKIIELSTLRIQDASGSPIALPAHLLLPGAYVVLAAAANAAVLQSASASPVLGTAIGSTILNNDGDLLTLSDAAGNTIDRVSYTLDWHTDANKSDGGWSLERINPALPCLGRSNWQSCPLPPGGTPGAQNASYQATTDQELPRLVYAFPETPASVLLGFSEELDKTTAETLAEYHISPSITITAADILPARAFVRLTLATPLQPSVLYAVYVGDAVTDCSGNPVPATDTLFIGLTEKPEYQDIVVNEVMFNPATGNGRYVEFYNRSKRIFNWSEFFIASFYDGADVNPVTHDRLFLPGQYAVFTEFPHNIRSTFANIHPTDVLENDLPSMDDDAGNITLYWAKDGATVVLDSLTYSADWHNALLSSGDRDGVALERLDPNGPGNEASNWTSASASVTGQPGTPTLPNSQRLSASPGGPEWLTLASSRLSPDADGFEDFLEIRYELPRAGFFAAMTVFDAEGVPVKRLVRQELIGTEGFLRWDGDIDNGDRAQPGIYVLLLELYAPDGTTERMKKTVAVVGKF